MVVINKYKLDNIFYFKRFLDDNINSLFFNLEQGAVTEFYTLYNIISENVCMNLNYWLTCNPEYCYAGYPGAYRNIRNSIEAYYDLYNLVSDETYSAVLKKQTSYELVSLTMQDYENLRNYKCYKSSKQKYFTIKDKANIANKKNNLNPEIQKMLESISCYSNAYVHPDVYRTINDFNLSTFEIDKLLNTDCLLLAYSAELYVCYLRNKYNVAIWLDIYGELQKLKNLNSCLLTEICI